MHVRAIADLAEPARHPAVVEAQDWLQVVWEACFWLHAPGRVREAVSHAQEQLETRGPVWMRREARRMRELGRRELRARTYHWDVGVNAGIRACFVAAWVLTTCAAGIDRGERRARITAGVRRWEREEG